MSGLILRALSKAEFNQYYITTKGQTILKNEFDRKWCIGKLIYQIKEGSLSKDKVFADLAASANKINDIANRDSTIYIPTIVDNLEHLKGRLEAKGRRGTALSQIKKALRILNSKAQSQPTDIEHKPFNEKKNERTPLLNSGEKKKKSKREKTISAEKKPVAPETKKPTPAKAEKAQKITPPTKQNSESVKVADTSATVPVQKTHVSKLEEQIHKGISQLGDLNSSDFAKKIDKLVKDLDKAAIDHPEKEKDIQSLIFVLKTLKDPRAFTPHPREQELLSLMKQTLSTMGIKAEYDATNIKSFSSSARSDILRFLKRKNPAEIFLNNDKKIKEIESKSLFDRINSLYNYTNKIDTTNIVNNLFILFSSFEEFDNKSKKIIKENADLLTDKFDAKTNGKFNKLIYYYKHLDLKNNSELFKNSSAIFYKEFQRSDLCSNICNLTADKFEKELTSIYERTYPLFTNTVKDKIKNLLPKFIWFFDNLKNIQKPYSQDSDTNRNLDKGTCCENSFRRLKKLFENPNIDSKDIDMGSTAEDRFAHLQAIDGDQQSDTISNMLGLKKVVTVVLHIDETKDIGEQVVELLFEKKVIMNSHYEHNGTFVLSFYNKENTRGHSINVQYDTVRNIYRFIDDNTGIIRYISSLEFREEFRNYLNIFYPSRVHFIAELTESK